MLDRVRLVKQLACPSNESGELAIGKGKVAYRTYRGHAIYEFNVPKIENGNNFELLLATESIAVLNSTTEQVDEMLTGKIATDPKWNVLSIELAENRLVEDPRQYMRELAKKSLVAASGGHKNRYGEPTVYFGPNSRKTRIYWKHFLEGEGRQSAIRHEIIMEKSALSKALGRRSLSNLEEFLVSGRAIEVLNDSWKTWSARSTKNALKTVLERSLEDKSKTGQRLSLFIALSHIFDARTTMELLRLSRSSYYSTKRKTEKFGSDLQ